jgi:hypothetical protein
MSESETEPIAQMWYTWTPTGGFNVPLASPGLNAEQWSHSAYTHYSLPPGTDESKMPPESAPVCLAYVCTEEERALVHKVYIDPKKYSLPGTPVIFGIYFIHLLVGLENFSALNAIALWRSSFWRVADSAEGTQLAPTSLRDIKAKDGHDPLEVQFQNVAALERQFKGVTILRPQEEAATQKERLCFLIQAFLIQQDMQEQHGPRIKKLEDKLQELEEDLKERRSLIARSRPGRSAKEIQQDIEKLKDKLQIERATKAPVIYIAAPPDEVAYLIAALVRVMPARFREDITFSTYEDQIPTELPLRIVGTCPPPVPLDPRSRQEEDILHDSCYKSDKNGLALNTYLAKQSPLPEILSEDPAIPPYNEILATYADDAVAAVQTGDFKELDEFFKDIGDVADTREFLRQYYNLVIKVKWLSLVDINGIFSDPALARAALKKKRVRDQIFHRSYRDDQLQIALAEGKQKETRQEHLQWLHETLPPLAARLRSWCLQNAGIHPADASAVKQALDMVEQDAFEQLIASAANKVYDFFITTHSLLTALAPRNRSSSRWINALMRLSKDQQHLLPWEIRDLLLEDAVCVLTPENQEHGRIVSPLLRITNPADFGRLLAPSRAAGSGKAVAFAGGALRLPFQWSYFAARNFLAASRAASAGAFLNFQTVRQLERYRSPLYALIEQFLQIKEPPDWWNTAEDLFLELARYGYPYTFEMLQLWLNQPLNGRRLQSLLEAARLNEAEQVHILEASSAKYLQQEDTAPVITMYFANSARQLAPEDRWIIAAQTLETLLSPEQFGTRSQVSKERVNAFLKAARLTTEQRNDILEHFAARLLASHSLPGLVPDLYGEIIDTSEGRRKYRLPLLYKVCDMRPPVQVANELLQQASLSDDEALDFFKRYEKGNFAFCYRSRIARALYHRLLIQYPEAKSYLYLWLEQKLTEEEVQELLTAVAPVLSEQDVLLLTRYGKKLFSSAPRSEALFDLTRLYLHQLPEAAFRPNKPEMDFMLFLKKQHESNLPPGIKEQVDNWYKLWEFIRHPSCQQSRVREIDGIIHVDLPDQVKSSLIAPLAEAFAACIDNAIQLGSVITTMHDIGETELARLLASMVAYVLARLKERSREYERWQMRACAYLQFACESDDDTLPGGQNLIDTLLQGASLSFLDFVNQQAEGWSGSGKARWEFARSRFQLPSLAPAVNSVAAPLTEHAVQPPAPAPAAGKRAAGQSPASVPARKQASSQPAMPASPLWNLDDRSLLPASFAVAGAWLFLIIGLIFYPPMQDFLRLPVIRSLPILPIVVGLWLLLIIFILWSFPLARGLMRFPYLIVRFWRIKRSNGMGKRVAFCGKYRRELIALGSMFPRAWRQEIRFACDFHDKCQIADTRGGKEDEQAILDLVDDQKNSAYRHRLSAHEWRRVQNARNIATPPLSASPIIQE